MRKEEKGQTIVLVALIFVGLLMAAGLAMDGGRLLLARREAQNAADAAALAGARELASQICGSGSAAADQQVWDAVVAFSAQNGLSEEDLEGLQAWYVDKNGNQLGEVGSGSIPNGATGVEVSLATGRRTLFVHLLGPEEMEAPAEALAMAGPVTQLPGGVLPIGVPLDVVEALVPGQTFYVMETNNQHNGGMFCVDPDGVQCIGDPARHNAHRGWLNLNYIYNIEHRLQSDPFYRTFEQNVPNRGCGPDPHISTDDGLQGWASGNCPYPFPIFAGAAGAANGDFIHGDPGARQSSLQEVYANYAGRIAYTPVFDYVYMSDYMAEYFDPPEGIGWPRAGGGGYAFLYHIVGFVAVRVGEGHGPGTHYLEGAFQEAIIGEGVIQPGAGIGGSCLQPMVYGVTLWQ
jgi:hypothetical protein